MIYIHCIDNQVKPSDSKFKWLLDLEHLQKHINTSGLFNKLERMKGAINDLAETITTICPTCPVNEISEIESLIAFCDSRAIEFRADIHGDIRTNNVPNFNSTEFQKNVIAAIEKIDKAKLTEAKSVEIFSQLRYYLSVFEDKKIKLSNQLDALNELFEAVNGFRKYSRKLLDLLKKKSVPSNLFEFHTYIESFYFINDIPDTIKNIVEKP